MVKGFEVQTFLPYSDFARSARCLDPKRLGNQAYNECRVLINGGWQNHPASKMWRGYEPALATYALRCLEELTRRGRHYPHHYEFFYGHLKDEIIMPSWLGDERIHSSHRSVLLWKNFDWYSQFGWTEQPTPPDAKGRLPYFWPI